MKKINTNKLVALLAALCLMTSAFVGSTLAKYTTTSEKATDSARVAKWGVTITANATNDFAKTYAKDSNTSIENTVVSENEVVAPGTKGTLGDVTISGSPEVAFEVTYVPDLKLEGWNDYCPIIIKVEDTPYYIGKDDSVTDTATLETAVEAAIKACTKQYAAGTNTFVATDAPTVTWEWPFDADVEGNLLASYQTDEKDTILGNAAADDNAAKITLELTTTATQID